METLNHARTRATLRYLVLDLGHRPLRYLHGGLRRGRQFRGTLVRSQHIPVQRLIYEERPGVERGVCGEKCSFSQPGREIHETLSRHVLGACLNLGDLLSHARSHLARLLLQLRVENLQHVLLPELGGYRVLLGLLQFALDLLDLRLRGSELRLPRRPGYSRDRGRCRALLGFRCGELGGEILFPLCCRELLLDLACLKRCDPGR